MNRNLKLIPVNDMELWDQLFKKCDEVDLMQTWEYGNCMNQTVGWEPFRQLITEKDVPIALAQVLVKEIPGSGMVARIQHGPMFAFLNNSFSHKTVTQVLNLLRNYWVDEKAMSLHLSPCLHAKN